MTSGEREMISALTERLKMYIGVQGTVESILGAIFEIYLRLTKNRGGNDLNNVLFATKKWFC